MSPHPKDGQAAAAKLTPWCMFSSASVVADKIDGGNVSIISYTTQRRSRYKDEGLYPFLSIHVE